MLLGADVFWDVISTEQIRLGKDKPVLQNSIFGWLLAGPVMCNANSNSRIACNFSQDISHQLQRFWELEEVPSKPVMSPEDEACEQHFLKYTQRLEDGRFCVRMPLKTEPEKLGNSYYLARKRFESLERRFQRQPEVKEQYVNFIQEYQDLGHASEIERPDRAVILPHHPVLKEQHESTKCRVVFDASAKTTSGLSLNDVMMIEAILNSRPLVPLSSHPNDLSPLTPGHFLVGRPLTSLPTPDLKDANPSRLHRYARIEQARQHFWTRWSREYICELQQRTKWQTKHPNIEPGQLVLIRDERCPPLKWPLGRITSVYPGSDGAIRVVDILTSQGQIRRAINRVCPLLDEE
ncbi:uncharacterized protein LOC114361037 [Ostrinia furnacalis]|uniref:uncharacterized protein LOC114361037 n=1 Tax=Ostrinia furnacalis TaxID=93504 RepID=UPI00103BA0FE|nr:uncharacterized protein LOC114361037 [Ostrinia furnacalis]